MDSICRTSTKATPTTYARHLSVFWRYSGPNGTFEPCLCFFPGYFVATSSASQGSLSIYHIASPLLLQIRHLIPRFARTFQSIIYRSIIDIDSSHKDTHKNHYTQTHTSQTTTTHKHKQTTTTMFSCTNYERGCRGRCNSSTGRCDSCVVLNIQPARSNSNSSQSSTNSASSYSAMTNSFASLRGSSSSPQKAVS